MSIRTEVCQILGKDSQNSVYSKKKPLKGYVWSGRRLTKVQTTTRPDHACPEVWSKIGKAAQNREKQEWAIERPMLGDRGIYFVDLMTKITKKLSNTR